MQKSATLNRFVKPNKRRDKIYLVLFYSDAIGHKNDDLCQFYGKVTFYGVLCGTGRFNPNPLTYVTITRIFCCHLIDFMSFLLVSERAHLFIVQKMTNIEHP